MWKLTLIRCDTFCNQLEWFKWEFSNHLSYKSLKLTQWQFRAGIIWKHSPERQKVCVTLALHWQFSSANEKKLYTFAGVCVHVNLTQFLQLDCTKLWQKNQFVVCRTDESPYFVKKSWTIPWSWYNIRNQIRVCVHVSNTSILHIRSLFRCWNSFIAWKYRQLLKFNL